MKNLKPSKLNESESKELEELAVNFGKKFDHKYIQGTSVYGYTMDNKKEYLGTTLKHDRYNELKSRIKKSAKIIEEHKSHESLLESL